MFRFVSKARDVVLDNKPVQQDIFSPKIIITAISFFFYSLKKSRQVSNSSSFFRYLKSTLPPKHSFTSFSQSLERDSQYTSFMSPNILLLAKFSTNVVFPHPVCPTIKIFPSNLLSSMSFVFLKKKLSILLLEIVFVTYIKKFWCCR